MLCSMWYVVMVYGIYLGPKGVASDHDFGVYVSTSGTGTFWAWGAADPYVGSRGARCSMIRALGLTNHEMSRPLNIMATGRLTSSVEIDTRGPK